MDYILKYKYNKLDSALDAAIKGFLNDVCTDESTKLKIDISLNANKEMPAIFTAEQDGRMEALLYLFAPRTTEIEVSAIVRPSLRRKGIFKWLLNEAIQESAKFGYTKGLFVAQGSEAESIMAHWGCPLHHTEQTMLCDIKHLSVLDDELQLMCMQAEDVRALSKLGMLIFEIGEEETISMLKASLAASDRCFWRLRKDGKDVGLCGTAVQEDGLMAYGLGIHPDERRKGYASAMLHHLAQEAKAQGYNKLYLEVDEDNSGAKALYHSFGFKEQETVRYYAFDFDKIIKLLSSNRITERGSAP